jgi:hypothetical protein
MTDERSKNAVDVAERYADRTAIDEELRAAFVQAQEAYVEASNHYNDTVRFSNTGDEPDVQRAAHAVAAAGAACETSRLYRFTLYPIWRIGPEEEKQCRMRLHELFGPLPFRPVSPSPAWLTPTVKQLATGIYEERAFERLPLVADALEEAGCANADILTHCRGPGPHVRGCWVVDLLLGKE